MRNGAIAALCVEKARDARVGEGKRAVRNVRSIESIGRGLMGCSVEARGPLSMAISLVFRVRSYGSR